MTADLVDAETLAGMLRKAGRVVERAAKHDRFGSQRLWEISAAIKDEAKRIAVLEQAPLAVGEHVYVQRPGGREGVVTRISGHMIYVREIVGDHEGGEFWWVADELSKKAWTPDD